MANKLFKTRQVGSTYVYVHAEKGNDITGTGTETNPYQSLMKAHSVYSGRTKLLRGANFENISSAMTIVGDEAWQTMYTTSRANIVVTCTNIQALTRLSLSNSSFTDCIIQSTIAAGQNIVRDVFHAIIRSFAVTRLNNSTVVDIESGSGASNNEGINGLNSIFVGIVTISPYNAQDTFRYCAFSGRTCIFYYKNDRFTPVAKPAWVTDPYENMRLLKRAIDPTWSEFGGNTELDTIFQVINIQNQKFETCMIIADDGVLSPRIFADYENDDVTPKSFYLNNSTDNKVLYATEVGGYAGALPAAQKSDIGVTVVNVSPAGVDDGQGVLAYVDGEALTNNIDKSTYDGQTWNRISTPVFAIGSDSKFIGANNYGFISGRTYGFYVGKKQTLFGPQLMQSGGAFAVVANTMYRVIDPGDPINAGVLVTQGVESNTYKNGVSFLTPLDTTEYTVTANNENVYLAPVLNEAFESLEVYPYDDLNTPSTNFPAFSSPLNSEVKVLYHRTGTRAGLPVLFSELSTNVDPYFSNFAVSNADSVYFDLITDAVNYEGRDVSIYFCRVEVNINYDKNLSNV